MEYIKKSESPISKIWKVAIGSPKELSGTNRIFNTVLIITTLFLVSSAIVNVAAGLKEPFLINSMLLVVAAILYHFSRFKGAYKVCLVVYAVCCYIAVISTFIFNDGTKGPVLFLSFLSFLLLISITPQKQHLIWTSLHVVVGFGLIYMEYVHPEFVRVHYDFELNRFTDIALTYVVCLLFIYLITIHLRRNYEKEKKLAQKRASLMRLRSVLIGKQNKQLREIAWIQSHKVRGKVATIMGLIALMNEDDVQDPINEKVLKGVKSASIELDEIIKDINDLTSPFKK